MMPLPKLPLLAQWPLAAWLALRRCNGLSLLAAAGLLAGAVALAAARHQVSTEQAALQQALLQQRAALARLAVLATPGSGPANAQAQRAERLGEAGAVEVHLGRVFDAVRRAGLVLEVGDHSQQVARDSGLTRHQIQLPVTGPWPAVRDLADRVLLALPFAALDRLTVKRDNAEADQVQARLQWSLHLQGAGAAAPAPPRVSP